MRKFSSAPVKALIICVALMSSTLMQCSDDTTTTPPTPLQQLQERLAQTPRANEEAELMALWYSSEITAPNGLYDELANELSALCAEWRDSIPALDSVRFWPTIMPSELMIDPAEDGIAALREGSYHDWDSLNSLFRATNVDTLGWTDSWHMTYLQFQGKVNTESLVVRYSQLPLIAGVYTELPLWPWTNIYPDKRDSGWVMLMSLDRRRGPFDFVQKADFWYFRKVGGHYDYVGHYYFNGAWDPESLPEWADDAFPMFCRQHPNLGSPYCPEDSS